MYMYAKSIIVHIYKIACVRDLY